MTKDTNLFAEGRKIKIVEYLEEHKRASVVELVDYFNVSSSTIRNDLKDLASANLLIRTHGGAIVKSQTGFELKSKQKVDQNLEAKQKIAKLALGLIEDGDTILMDSGTTTLELAKQLRQIRDLSVVTNCLLIAMVLEKIETVEVIMMGGLLRKGFHCTVGLSGRDILSGLTVDKAFMGLNGFTVERGASTPNISHAEIKKAMIKIAKKVVVLCDSSKFGRDSFAQFASLDDIDTLVSDKIPDTVRGACEEKDIETLCPTGL